MYSYCRRNTCRARNNFYCSTNKYFNKCNVILKYKYDIHEHFTLYLYLSLQLQYMSLLSHSTLIHRLSMLLRPVCRQVRACRSAAIASGLRCRQNSTSVDHSRRPSHDTQGIQPVFRRTLPPNVTRYDIAPYRTLHIVIHGLTATIADIDHIISQSPIGFVLRIGYRLERLRKERKTSLTVLYDNETNAARVRELLEKHNMNGARIKVQPIYRTDLPPKWDPLHISPQSGPGKAVSIEGLPFTTQEHRLRRALAGYDLVDNPDYRLYRIYRAGGTSSWLVRTKSEEEAQRLVRNVHRTYYNPEFWGLSNPLIAEVFY